MKQTGALQEGQAGEETGRGVELIPNLYAPPKARLELYRDEEQSLWRAGKILVCRRDAVFPLRCVKCNQPSVLPTVRYRFSWHHIAWFLLLFLWFVPYLLAVPFVRRRARVDVGLCEAHQKRRLTALIVGFGGFACIMLLVCLTLSKLIPSSIMSYVFLAAIVWAIVSMMLPLRFSVVRIGKEFVRIRGCGADFLDSLTEFWE